MIKMEAKNIFSVNDKPIGICSDHAGFKMKEYFVSLLKLEGVAYNDFGTYSSDSCDYPDFAHLLAKAIENGECEKGIAICGTGNGINMVLNKHQHIRSALCWSGETAFYARAHNDANVLTLPGRVIADEEAKHIAQIFFNTNFEGGRHQLRVDKIPVK